MKSAVRLPPTGDERDAAREKERAKPYGVRTSVAYGRAVYKRQNQDAVVSRIFDQGGKSEYKIGKYLPSQLLRRRKKFKNKKIR